MVSHFHIEIDLVEKADDSPGLRYRASPWYIPRKLFADPQPLLFVQLDSHRLSVGPAGDLGCKDGFLRGSRSKLELRCQLSRYGTSRAARCGQAPSSRRNACDICSSASGIPRAISLHPFLEIPFEPPLVARRVALRACHDFEQARTRIKRRLCKQGAVPRCAITLGLVVPPQKDRIIWKPRTVRW